MSVPQDLLEYARKEASKLLREEDFIHAKDFYERGFQDCYDLLNGNRSEYFCPKCHMTTVPNYGKCRKCNQNKYARG